MVESTAPGLSAAWRVRPLTGIIIFADSNLSLTLFLFPSRDLSRPESEGCWVQPGVAACRGVRLNSGELETGGKSTAGPLSPVPGVFSHLRLEFLPQSFSF